MDYFCEDCGSVFSESEISGQVETHGFGDGLYEHFDACPCCGSTDIVCGSRCVECENPYREDELYGGYCADCLRELVTYNNALQYLRANKLLGSFVCWLYNDGSEPDKFTPEFEKICENVFLQRQEADAYCEVDDFLETVRDYIMEDDGLFGKESFAEFLNNRQIITAIYPR